MFLRIQHKTLFSYSSPAFIEPLTVRLRPRSDCWQKLHQFNMEFDPSPKGITESVDLDGTSTSFLWFGEPCSSLTITTTSCVETLRDNPFDFILGDKEFFELPARLSDFYQISLGPYLHRENPSEKVDAFAREIAQKVQLNTASFLMALCTGIHERIRRTIRPDGEPLKPEEVLTNSQGACRDSTVLFMDACRSLGLPSRFTSGYFFGDEEFEDRQLHAWAEVYLPGGGWRGYDPTVGLAVSNLHVALASGPTPFLTAPTTGSYRGNNVDSRMDFQIQIQPADSLEELLNPQYSRLK